MGLFSKKPSIEDVLKRISALPDDEKAKLRTLFVGEDDVGEEGTDTTPVVESAEADPEVTEENTVGTEEHKPATEDAAEKTDADDAPEETEPTEEDQTEDNGETNEALSARITALEEKVAELTQRLTSPEEEPKNDNTNFGGYSPDVPDSLGDNNEDDDSRIMRSYMAKQTYRK